MRYWGFGVFVWVMAFIALRWLFLSGPDSNNAVGWAIGLLCITGLAFKAVDWLYDEDHTVRREFRGNKIISYIDYSQPRRRKERPVEPTEDAPTPWVIRRDAPAMTCPRCGSEFWTILGTTDRYISENQDELYECHSAGGCSHVFRANRR